MKNLNTFIESIKRNELAENTIKSYTKDIKHFLKFINGKEINKENLILYKESLKDNFKTSSINLKITTINKYLKFIDIDIDLKHNKKQSNNSTEDYMSIKDYGRIIRFADKLNKTKIKLIMQTLASTGIRISELEYITLESLNNCHTTVNNKKKERSIILPTKLVKDLKEYCKNNNIKSGIIFTGRNGNLIDKAYVWRQMKYIAGQARVKKNKIHAHSFRHLFAKEFLNKHDDITLLADLLGHENLETTRLYAKRSKREQRNILDNLNILN